MKIIRGFFIFIGSFLAYHLVLQNFFPATPDGVLDAPGWYSPVGLLFAFLVALWMTREKVSKTPYVCIGVQTSGFEPAVDEILELAAVRFVKDREVARFCALVKPKESYNLCNIRLSGVTAGMLMAAAPIEEVLPRFLYFIGDDLLVAHCIEFDFEFLNAACARIGHEPVRNPAVDTLDLSRARLPKLRNHKRSTVMAHLRLKEDDSSRAIPDCLNNQRCYVALRK